MGEGRDFSKLSDQVLGDLLVQQTRLKGSVIGRMSREDRITELERIERSKLAKPRDDQERPKTTQKVRLSIDLELREPHDAKALYALGEYVAESITDGEVIANAGTDDEGVQIITSAKVVQLVPTEANFDWQGQ